MRSALALSLLAAPSASSLLSRPRPGRVAGTGRGPPACAFAAPASSRSDDDGTNNAEEVEEVDVAIVGAGIGGLCAGAILNTLYGKKVGVYESHYLAGGCAHAFERSAKIGDEDGATTTFAFDSGPTIVLGCSKEPYNPLQQVLRAVGVDGDVRWIPYDGWGMM